MTSILAKRSDDLLRTTPCALCRQTVFHRAFGSGMFTSLMVNAMQQLASADWRPAAEALTREDICHDCRDLLTTAFNESDLAKNLLLKAQAIHVSPALSDVMQQFGVAENPEPGTAQSNDELIRDFPLARLSTLAILPSDLRVQIDRAQRSRMELSGKLAEQQLSNEDLEAAVETFINLLATVDVAIAWDGTSCVGLWVAEETTLSRRHQLKVPVTPLALRVYVDHLVKLGLIAANSVAGKDALMGGGYDATRRRFNDRNGRLFTWHQSSASPLLANFLTEQKPQTTPIATTRLRAPLLIHYLPVVSAELAPPLLVADPKQLETLEIMQRPKGTAPTRSTANTLGTLDLDSSNQSTEVMPDYKPSCTIEVRFATSTARIREAKVLIDHIASHELAIFLLLTADPESSGWESMGIDRLRIHLSKLIKRLHLEFGCAVLHGSILRINDKLVDLDLICRASDIEPFIQVGNQAALLRARALGLDLRNLIVGTPLFHQLIAAPIPPSELIQLLRALDIDPSSKDGTGKSALLIACERHDLELISTLLEQGADTSATDAKGEGALHILVSQQAERATIELLARAGAPLNLHRNDGHTALSLAAGRNDFDRVKVLLACGAAVDEPGAEGYTALHQAVAHLNQEMAEALLNAGANINAKIPETRNTALHIAAQKGSVPFVEMLVRKGADIMWRDSANRDAEECAGNEQTREWLRAEYRRRNPPRSMGMLGTPRKPEIRWQIGPGGMPEPYIVANPSSKPKRRWWEFWKPRS